MLKNQGLLTELMTLILELSNVKLAYKITIVIHFTGNFKLINFHNVPIFNNVMQ